MSMTTCTIEQVARGALEGESRLLRGITMAFLRQNPRLNLVPRPETDDKCVLAAAASLLELFAQRSGQPPPEWTRDIGPLPNPIYLVKGIGPATTRSIRRLARDESPEPLRKRGFLATPNYLSFV